VSYKNNSFCYISTLALSHHQAKNHEKSLFSMLFIKAVNFLDFTVSSTHMLEIRGLTLNPNLNNIKVIV
jgi:hypothetical protein